jgi:hypothetical protein
MQMQVLNLPHMSETDRHIELGVHDSAHQITEAIAGAEERRGSARIHLVGNGIKKSPGLLPGAFSVKRVAELSCFFLA